MHKFLTREQTYSSLLVAISDAERRIDAAKNENRALTEQLHQLQINSDKDGVRMRPEELRLRNQADAAERELMAMLSREQKAGIVYDQVAGWARRIHAKLTNTVGSGYGSGFEAGLGADAEKNKRSVPGLLGEIAGLVE